MHPYFLDINECATDPCRNGATCVDDVNKATCQCAEGWTGDTCESGQYCFVVVFVAEDASPFVGHSYSTVLGAIIFIIMCCFIPWHVILFYEARM